jgi:hypothetical protein
MGEAQTIIVETGLGIIFIEMIRNMNPGANIIYFASDDLAVIGCSPYIGTELSRVAGDADSIAQAIQSAMRQGKHKPGHYLSWAEVAKRVVNPGAYPDTPLLPADGRAALARAVA